MRRPFIPRRVLPYLRLGDWDIQQRSWATWAFLLGQYEEALNVVFGNFCSNSPMLPFGCAFHLKETTTSFLDAFYGRARPCSNYVRSVGTFVMVHASRRFWIHIDMRVCTKAHMTVRLCCHWNYIMVSADRGSLFGGSCSAALNAPTLRRACHFVTLDLSNIAPHAL